MDGQDRCQNESGVTESLEASVKNNPRDDEETKKRCFRWTCKNRISEMTIIQCCCRTLSIEYDWRLSYKGIKRDVNDWCG